MSKRIGELLLEKGLINPVQLDQGLRAQLFFGGHLGTCLTELGFVDQDALGQALAEILGLAYASDAELDEIPEEVLHLFDVKMVEKYQAIPIRLEQNTLHLAVIDPKTLGRLSAITGYKLKPWVTPESRLLEAMEGYYGIQRSARHVRLSRGMIRPAPEEPCGASVPQPQPAESDPTSETVDATDPSQLGSTMGGSGLGAEFGYGTPWREVADELLEDEPETDSADDPPESHERQERSQGPPGGTVYQRMSCAQDKTELARVVLDYLTERMPGAILFTVKAGTASLWDAAGLELNCQRAASLRFPVASGSVFELMLGDGHYRGPIPDNPGCRWFHAALGLEPPEEILLLPVYLNDRLVAIIYGDGGSSGEIRGSTDLFGRLAEKLGLSFSMLVLKIKIAS